ncbi:MAG: RNA polymerase subunit sigma-70 [Thermoleophilia bacterium]
MSGGAVDPATLAAARNGDEAAFVRLTAPYRDRLHRHCYRMLGSLHDADDAHQELMLRAWRGIGGYRPQGAFEAWLTRIATNVCLRILETRQRTPPPAPDAHLEPYPDALLGSATVADPLEQVSEREQVGLAMVAAMQLLPPRQRVAVLLRDVLGYSAAETASQLGVSRAAANSALQRARQRLDREARDPTLGVPHRPDSLAVEREVMQRFQRAWTAMDFPALVALLSEDALLTMPPEDLRFHGGEAVGGFFATIPLGGRLDRILFRPTRVNRQPALAAYADEATPGRHDAYGLMVFSIQGDRIRAITGFPRRPDLFTRLGLPVTLPQTTDTDGGDA